MLAYDFRQVGNNLVIERVGGQLDGDAVDGLLLDSLQQFDVRYLKLLHLGVAETRLHLSRDAHSSPLDELTVQVEPVVAEEHQLARALKVFERDDTPGFVGLGTEARLDAGDDAAEGYVLAVDEGSTAVGEFGTMGITEIVEHYLVLV